MTLRTNVKVIKTIRMISTEFLLVKLMETAHLQKLDLHHDIIEMDLIYIYIYILRT